MNINEFRQLISEVTNMPVDTITPQASFKDDLAIDSLQLVNLVIEVAGRLKSDLKNIQSLKDISTVQGFYNLLQEV
jgi:acyl carrier protein